MSSSCEPTSGPICRGRGSPTPHTSAPAASPTAAMMTSSGEWGEWGILVLIRHSGAAGYGGARRVFLTSNSPSRRTSRSPDIFVGGQSPAGSHDRPPDRRGVRVSSFRVRAPLSPRLRRRFLLRRHATTSASPAAPPPAPPPVRGFRPSHRRQRVTSASSSVRGKATSTTSSFSNLRAPTLSCQPPLR